MSVTRDVVIEALRPVEDPELHRSIVDLGMVREVDIEGPRVHVLIALTVSGCPLRAEITRRVTEAVIAIDGIEDVAVDMTVMSPEELDALRSRLQGEMPPHVAGGNGNGHSHGPDERRIPFAAAGSRTRILGITSGKGGVGKSSVTVNLAATLARRGHDVAILDADVYGYSVPGMLGVRDEPVVEDDMVIPPEVHGVRCISLGFFVEDDKPVMWRGPMLHKALEQFLVDVEWGTPDYLLVDMPPGTGDVAMSMAKMLPGAEIYVVTTPQPAAQRVAQRSGAMAREIDLPLAGVIENMSWFAGDDGKRYELFGNGGGAALAERLQVPLLAQLPLVPALREGADEGRPVVVDDASSEIGFAFEQLAIKIEKAGPRRIYREELKIL
jgi:ATP-binding protein involved in chromosome partitioning